MPAAINPDIPPIAADSSILLQSIFSKKDFSLGKLALCGSTARGGGEGLFSSCWIPGSFAPGGSIAGR
jgi:hypothetical protein